MEHKECESCHVKSEDVRGRLSPLVVATELTRIAAHMLCYDCWLDKIRKLLTSNVKPN